MSKSNIIKTNFERKVLRSSDTNVFKFVFTKPDIAVEAVLYRYGSSPAPSALVAYSERDFARLRESGLRGAFLRVCEGGVK